jgi:hypothetical protein
LKDSLLINSAEDLKSPNSGSQGIADGKITSGHGGTVTEIADSGVQLRWPAQNGDHVCRSQAAARPRIGEIVEVRSANQILATLDSQGKFEGVPFMPEMLSFCGRRFQVFKYADLTCTDGEPRYLSNTVHLSELRCDGSAHDNCGAKCLIFWKEAWITRIAPEDVSNGIEGDRLKARGSSATRSAAAFLSRHVERNGAMSCQATEIRSASRPLEPGLGNYVGTICRDFRAERIDWRDLWRLLRWMRARMLWSAFVWWARVPWNRNRYYKTPARELNLRPGDLVKVCSKWKILATLDQRGRNRGLRFTPEMFEHCGRKYRVLSIMQRRINERDGQLVEFGNSCVLLENVLCKGQRMFCTRTEYHYWREIWLERAEHSV